MEAYIYAADIYCEDCGLAMIKTFTRDLKGAGEPVPDLEDQASYDSGEFPKGPFDDGGGESDCPQHCGSHGMCLNAITLANGTTKVGCFLENPLTSDGYEYVREKIREEVTEIVQLWADYYDINVDETRIELRIGVHRRDGGYQARCQGWQTLGINANEALGAMVGLLHRYGELDEARKILLERHR